MGGWSCDTRDDQFWDGTLGAKKLEAPEGTIGGNNIVTSTATSSTNSALPRFANETGRVITNSGIIVGGDQVSLGLPSSGILTLDFIDEYTTNAGILIGDSGDTRLEFRDNDTYINSPSTGVLNLVGTTIQHNGVQAEADVQIFTSSGTWTKPAGKTFTQIVAISAGAGGGSGRRGAAGTVRCGGGGGAGGSVVTHVLQTALLGATETITIGTGGGGGAAQTTNDTNGNAGGDGSGLNTKFGTWVNAVGGTAGAGGTAASGAAGSGGTCSTNGVGFFNSGNGGAASTSGGAGATAAGVGGSGLPRGGGAGGGLTTGDVESAGGAGGAFTAGHYGTISGGTAGTAGGGDAGAGVDRTANYALGGTGGGGGGSESDGVGTGGDGGAGGKYGAGGGGGGASLNGANSGKGGAGGAGLLIAISY